MLIFQVRGTQNCLLLVYVLGNLLHLGFGIASSFGLHIGRQEGSTVFTQMSTGIVLEIDLNITTSTIQPTYWRNY